MNQTKQSRQSEWTKYYDRFNYFTPDNVRDGCQPILMEHANAVEKSIVLVHGLTDSPHFVSAIGSYFFEQLGYNVYMPLLHGHGLKEPKGMEGVDLNQWKANVEFAIDEASVNSKQVSIGGLSTGGTLSFYMAATNPRVTGSLYLFSAALDLAGGVLGELKERLLRTFMSELLDRRKPLIGPNPYRYGHIDMDGAKELAKLIKETDELTKQIDEAHPFPTKVFAAHSEQDKTANITGIEQLVKILPDNQIDFYRIPASKQVSHASLVLKGPVAVNEVVLEAANPVFDDMMEAIRAFDHRSNEVVA